MEGLIEAVMWRMCNEEYFHEQFSDSHCPSKATI